MNKTQEVHNSTNPTFVIDFLQAIMRTEITNKVERENNTLYVYLTDGSVGVVTAPKVARDTLPPEQKEAKIQNIATIRYITQHDYGYGDENRTELDRLELHNLDECATYVDDAVATQLNAYFTNNLIEFHCSGEKFLLAVELKQ